MSSDQSGRQKTGLSWRVRLALVLLSFVASGVVWTTNQFLTQRFTETTQNRADLRLALFSGNLISELQRAFIVPLVLSRDPSLIGDLNSGDFSQSSQRLISYADEISIGQILLMDGDGRVVAASDRNRIGENRRQSPVFLDARRSNETVFSEDAEETGGTKFYYSRKLESTGEGIGVISVEVGLRKFEKNWAGISDAVIVANSEGTIILSTEPMWRGQTEEEALATRSPTSAVRRAIEATVDWASPSNDPFLSGSGVLRAEARVAFRGWRMVLFTTYASVRERVNAVLALEIMAFAIFLALTFYFLSRRAQSRVLFFARESAELRQLNERLQREIAERKKVEETLQVAEQTLAQSSKLAALGEMSAAVTHELNQPLAAMKTYLAGAKLLLSRKRPDEAVSSFQRIDDLIERMGAITKQLKSYAHKGGDELRPIDVRASVLASVQMMEPNLRQRTVRITTGLPDEPVWVVGDNVRLEQVIINLLRNAIDATDHVADPTVDILLSVGDTATLTVRDNGDGIDDLEELFEPFYTTKAPGEGVGLGLAISSGIINDLGGRLTARNGEENGAVFEINLPLCDEEMEAAALAARRERLAHRARGWVVAGNFHLGLL